MGLSPTGCGTAGPRSRHGAAFLVFPRTGLWWLEHYRGLRDHLDENYTRLAVDEQVETDLARLPRLQRTRHRDADAVGADVGRAALDGRLPFHRQHGPYFQDLACGSPLICHDSL